MLSSWTTGTAALAFVLYVIATILRLRSAPDGQTVSIRIESLAWLVLLIHVGFAFHEHHHWSHAAAEAHVAQETAETVGIRWRGGIYFNHALLILWPFGLASRWKRRSPAASRRRLLGTFIDLYVALMWLSATVLFGSTVFRVVGAVGFCLIALAWGSTRRSAPTVENRPQTQH